jgi:site-specific DNA-methyltransferase (adenine-specific)
VLYNGDCLEVMPTLAANSVDLILCDPPYRVVSGGTSSELAVGYRGSILEKNDGKIFKHNDIEIADYLPEFYRILKPGSHCYVMTNNINLRELLNVAERVGFGFHNLLAWRKNNCTANRWYMKEAEWVCFFYKRPAKPINHMGSKQIFEFDNIRGRVHPTQKPVELMLHYIENSTTVGQVVLDPFLGSGTTGVAARNCQRNFIGIERDPDYFAIARERIEGARKVIDFTALRSALLAEHAAREALVALQCRLARHG